MKLVKSCDGGQSASASTSGCPGSGISGLEMQLKFVVYIIYDFGK
jgi:hypothetical protein